MKKFYKHFLKNYPHKFSLIETIKYSKRKGIGKLSTYPHT